MFPTQFSFPKQEKQQTFSNHKISINFTLLESFFKNLVDQSIRPSILDFFQLQDKIDIRKKFDKYQQSQIINNQEEEISPIKNDGMNIVENLIKKDIVLNVPNINFDSHLNKIIEGPNGSKINYFIISQSLKNTISNTHNIFKKSTETKRQQKESIENLHSFIHQNQAVFFLLRGNLQIHKKIIPNQQKNKSSSNTKHFNHHHHNHHQNNNHYQSHHNKQSLKSFIDNSLRITNNYEKEKSNHHQYSSQNKIPVKEWKKNSEVKQHSFFCLRNYKTLNHQNLTHQNLKLVPKTACILAKIIVNPTFGNQYLETKNHKFSLISSFLTSKKQHDPQKLQNLKSIVDCFEQEKIRRETIISFQGRNNNKIYIIEDDGEIEFSKNVYFNENGNVEGMKKLQILNFRGKTIINAQSYLNHSKNLVNIFRSNSFLKQSEKQDNEKNQHQQSSHFNGDKIQLNNKELLKNQLNKKQILKLENQIFTGKKLIKTTHPPLNANGKIHFGKNQQAFLQFNLPKLNQSNFTIKVNSAFITVYSIDIKKFQQIASQKMKKNLAKNYELIYITLLRKSLQRLDLFRRKIQVQGVKKSQQIKNYAALTSVKQTERFSPQLKNQNNINVSVAKLDFQHKKQFKGLKRNDLVFKEGQALEKKIQILDHNDKSKRDKKVMAGNFKKKIENLIIQNLNDIKNLNSARKRQDQKDKIKAELNQYFMGNIGQILNTQRFKNEKYLVTLNQKSQNSPQKQMKKSMSTGEVLQKDMFVDPSVFDPLKNKSMKISLLRKGHPCVKEDNNFLKGVQIEGYADTIKTSIAVKINETNKIKEQFLRIQSKCQSCKCYDDLDSYRNLSSYNNARPGTSQHRCSSHDVKYHTMKIGVNWKTKYSQFNKKVQYKTAYDPKSLQHKINKMVQDDEPFERVYNKIKVLKQKSLQKFNFNEHLLRKGKDVKSRKQRKKSLPLLL